MPAATTDIMSWLYCMTMSKKLGTTKQGAAAYKTPNGNITKVLKTDMYVQVGGEACEVPAGSELVVYRRLQRIGGTSSNEYGPKSSLVLATFFVKKNQRVVRIITVRMNGKVAARWL